MDKTGKELRKGFLEDMVYLLSKVHAIPRLQLKMYLNEIDKLPDSGEVAKYFTEELKKLQGIKHGK